VPVEKVAQPPLVESLNRCHTKDMNNTTRLSVICPAAPWENITTDADRAWDLCLDLSEEYGYAQVRQNGIVIGEYRDGR